MERIWLKSYPEGVPAEIDLSAVGSLGDFIAESVAKFRDRTAFISMGKAVSYGELDLKSRAFAGYLKNVAGLPRGARVALMMPNLLQYPIAAFGALRAGYVVVNCNPLVLAARAQAPACRFRRRGDRRPGELRRHGREGGRRDGAQIRDRHRRWRSTGRRQGARLSIRWCATSGAPFPPFICLTPCGSIARWPWARGARSRTPAVKPDDIAFLQYTGGTTGVPKGAMLTHRNMVANLRQIHAWIAPAIQAEGEIFVAALPLYHVFALQVNGFVPLMIGASNLMIANPRDIPALVKALRGTPFTVIPGVNTLFNALLNNKDFGKLDFSRMHFAIGGGMAVQRTVAERWQSTTGKPLIEAYGLTETSPAAIANPLTVDHFTGAIGLPLPSTDIAIRDDDGRDLKVGETGELCIKGPQVMAGYWNRPDETAMVMTADGFLRTGDIARVDERGYVYVVDRKKDMINVSGFNVYPNEIEDVAMGHPGVLEAGAVGVPDARTGEAVKLVVVRKDPSADRGRSRRLLPPASDRIQDGRGMSSSGIRCRTPMSARSCAANCAARTGRLKRVFAHSPPLLPEGAIRESELSLFNSLQRHFRVARDRGFEHERALEGRRKPAHLKLLARPRNGGKSVIAVELAHDPDDPIDRLEVCSRHRRVHRAVRHEQRLIEAADLKREELGRGLRHALSEDLPNEIAHPLHRKTLARGDLGDRNAAIEEADDPHFALGPVQPRGSSHRGGPAAANKGAGRGFGGIGLRGFADHHENKHRTKCAVWQENVGFPESGPAPRGRRSRRQDRGSGQARGRAQGPDADRSRSRRLLPPPFDRIQNAAACRIPRFAAAHQCRQDPAPRIARRGPAGRGMTRYRNGGVLTPSF